MVRDLRWRQLSLLAALWITGVVLAVSAITHETNEMFDNAMTEVARTIVSSVQRSGLAEEQLKATERLALAGDRKSYMTFQIRDANGSVTARSSKAPPQAFPVALRPGFTTLGQTRYVTRPLPDGSFVQVAEYFDERRDAFLGLLAGLGLPLLVLMVVGGAILSRGIGRAAAPISALVTELRARDGGDLTSIDAGQLPIELKPIAEDVNRLLSRIASTLAAERAFSANCAHELRNPIASARAQIDYIALYPNDASNAGRVQTVAASLQQLGHRIERLLQLSRAEAGGSIAGGPSDLLGVVRMLVDDYASRGHNVTLRHSDLTIAPVLLDEDAIGIAVQNLIDNAVKHSEQDKPVEVLVEASGRVRVINACPAISADRLLQLEKRFHRNRGSKPGGYGLGLAIVSELMRQCRGRLVIASPATDRSDGFEAALDLPTTVSDARITENANS